jgi:hypothetical protein
MTCRAFAVVNALRTAVAIAAAKDERRLERDGEWSGTRLGRPQAVVCRPAYPERT